MSDEGIDTNPRTVPSALPLRRSASATSFSSGDASDGELLEQLEAEEEDFDWGGFREERMRQLREEADRMNVMKQTGHGRYNEIKNEKELIMTASKESYVVIHFSHRDFRRCKIMDKHLEALAPLHQSTLFLKVDVSNVPWLVEKMQVKVLPCVICFVGGAAKDKIVGFEDFSPVEGKEDDFKTGTLELRLKHSGVIPKPGDVLPGQQQTPNFNFTNTTFASRGGSSGGARKIRQGRTGDDSGSENGDGR